MKPACWYPEPPTKLEADFKWQYAYEVGKFAKYAEGRSINELRPADIVEWPTILYDGGAASGTIAQKHAAPSFLHYREGFEEDEHAGRLLRAMNRPQMPAGSGPRRKTYTMTEEQAERVLASAAQRPGVWARDRALMHFLWSTWTRRAEACNLALPNLALEERLPQVVSKGAKSRTVVSDAAYQQDLARSGRFLSDRGIPVTTGRFLSHRRPAALQKALCSKEGALLSREACRSHGSRSAVFRRRARLCQFALRALGPSLRSLWRRCRSR